MGHPRENHTTPSPSSPVMLGRAGVQRARAGADQRAAGHGGLRVRARRRGHPRRRPPLAGRQRRGARVVRVHRRRPLRRVAGADAPGGERREQERRGHDRRRRALERTPRYD